MKNLEIFLAEVRKKSVAVYLACDERVAKDLSDTLERLAKLVEGCTSEIENYSRTSGDGSYYIPDEAEQFLKELDNDLRV